MVAVVEQRAAAVAPWDWDAAVGIRTDFDRALAAEPERESDARRLARQLGV